MPVREIRLYGDPVLNSKCDAIKDFGDKAKALIEDLLDIEIFSTMNILLKGKVLQNKEQIIDADVEIKLAQQKIDLYRQNVERLKQNNDELIVDYRNKINQAQQD
jgi:hypothetical protein